MAFPNKPTKSGKDDIRGLTNLLGNVKGHANGAINFGKASSDGTGSSQPTEGGANYDTETKAVNNLAKAVARLDGGQNAPATGRKVRGLTNLTEDVVGNGNGAINFGILNWSDSAEKGSKKKDAK